MYFTIKDPFNRNISLSNNAWEHVQERHPEFETWHPLQITIQQPNAIIPSGRKANREIYYKIGALDTYPPLYVAVVVGFNNDNDGNVITAHLSKEIKVGSGGYKYVSKK